MATKLLECGCKIIIDGENAEVKFCAVHNAAFDLYTAVSMTRILVRGIEDMTEMKNRVFALLDNANATVNKGWDEKMELETAIHTSKKIIASHDQNWPEDDWFSMGDAWDLNLFTNDDDSRGAVLYPVSAGQTRTETGYQILPDEKQIW